MQKKSKQKIAASRIFVLLKYNTYKQETKQKNCWLKRGETICFSFGLWLSVSLKCCCFFFAAPRIEPIQTIWVWCFSFTFYICYIGFICIFIQSFGMGAVIWFFGGVCVHVLLQWFRFYAVFFAGFSSSQAIVFFYSFASGFFIVVVAVKIG